jgi:hypothetical protein
VTALVLLCGAVYCAAYFLGTDEESPPTEDESPQQALEDTTESRSAKNKLSERAREMLNNLLKNFESTSFGPPPVDLFNIDGLEHRPTSAKTNHQNGQNTGDPLATNSIDPKTLNSQDRDHTI